MISSGSSRMLSSPSSTNDAFSPNGSPDTKLTAFSPEDARSKGHFGPMLTTPFMESRFQSIYSMPSDPFLTPTSSSNRAPLSATATAFTPVSLRRDGFGRGQPQHLAFNPASPIREVVNSNSSSLKQNIVNYAEIPDTANEKRRLIRPGVPSSPEAGRLNSERCERFFMIQNVPISLSCVALSGFFSRREFDSIKGPVLGELNSNGKVYVTFADSREAQRAVEKIHRVWPEWRIVSLTAREYVQVAEPMLLGRISDYDGQLLVSAFYDGHNPNLNESIVARSVESTIASFGDIKSFKLLCTAQVNICEFHVEFYNSNEADSAASALNGASVDGSVLEVSLYRPEESQQYVQSAAVSPVKEEPSRYERPFNTLTPTSVASRAARTPCMEKSPTGRSDIPSSDPAAKLLTWMASSGEAPRISRRYPEYRMPNQNAVDIERIRLGLDVRTTIMLRNIPNKIDQATLKSIVDETSHGKYDFMYLRIDFLNNCNVGYAFINFEDPIDIIDFVIARAGRTWNCFNSDKVAEVSYATIQGRDCLIQKFRNSSVMVENPSFRPKIFHTGTGPLAGTEETFPGPDNPSKLRRSVENAGNLGLFPPRVNHHYRDEHRYRHSIFDRGNVATEHDSYYFRPILPLRRPADTSSHPTDINNPLHSAPGTYQRRELMWYDPTVAEHGPHTA